MSRVVASFLIVKLGTGSSHEPFLFSSYSAIEAYAKDQIKEYMELSRQIERPAQIVDKRIDLALFFINGLTSRQYHNL